MVPVGDVDRRQRIERLGQRADGRLVVHHPHLVADAVVGGDVDIGFAQRRRAASMASIAGAAG